MKDCGEYQREISLLIDGELAEPQKTGLLRHIGQCDECRRVYDAFNAISLSLPEEAAPAGFAEDVMSAIKGLNVTPMPVPEKKRPFRWKRAAALAAFCSSLIRRSTDCSWFCSRLFWARSARRSLSWSR